MRKVLKENSGTRDLNDDRSKALFVNNNVLKSEISPTLSLNTYIEGALIQPRNSKLIPFSSLSANPSNPRQDLEIDEDLLLLSEDIQKHGIYTELKVITLNNGKYRVIEGNRRYEALSLIDRDNPDHPTLKAVRCNVVEGTPQVLNKLQYIENQLRKNWHPLDEVIHLGHSYNEILHSYLIENGKNPDIPPTDKELGEINLKFQKDLAIGERKRKDALYIFKAYQRYGPQIDEYRAKIKKDKQRLSFAKLLLYTRKLLDAEKIVLDSKKGITGPINLFEKKGSYSLNTSGFSLSIDASSFMVPNEHTKELKLFFKHFLHYLSKNGLG